MKLSLLVLSILVVQCYSVPLWNNGGTKLQSTMQAIHAWKINNVDKTNAFKQKFKLPQITIGVRPKRDVDATEAPAESSEVASTNIPAITEPAENYKEDIKEKLDDLEEHSGKDKHDVETLTTESSHKDIEIAQQGFSEQPKFENSTEQPTTSASPGELHTTSGSPIEEHSTPGSPAEQHTTSGSPIEQYPTSGSPAEQHPTSGFPSEQHPTSGFPAEQHPTPGSPAEQHITPGSLIEQYPTSGSPTEQHPPSGFPAEQHSTSESPIEQYPTSGSPAKQNPTFRSPPEQHPTSGSPAEQHATSRSPAEQYPTYKNPAKQHLTYENPAGQRPTYGSAVANHKSPIHMININSNINADSEWRSAPGLTDEEIENNEESINPEANPDDELRSALGSAIRNGLNRFRNRDQNPEQNSGRNHSQGRPIRLFQSFRRVYSDAHTSMSIFRHFREMMRHFAAIIGFGNRDEN